MAYETVQDFTNSTYEFRVLEINPQGDPINNQSILSTLDSPIRLITNSLLSNADGSYTLIGNSSTNLNPPHTPDKLFALRTVAPPPVPGCNDIVIEGGNGEINITGLTAPIEIVEVYDGNWNQVFRCQGTDCGNEQIISGLSAGNYFVKVQFYEANWTFICRLDNVEVIVSEGGVCSHPDHPAMSAIANAIPSLQNTPRNWDINDCDVCSWSGVTCNGAGRVEKIELVFGISDGLLPPEIGQLSELKELKMVSTLEAPLGIKSIPSEIGNLSKLEILQLRGQNFNEPIPAEIGNLSALRELDLAFSRIPGEIPTAIANLSNLQVLMLQHNRLTGDIPATLGNLSQLRVLRLGQFFRSGSVFFFTLNNITGPIPPELGQLTNLEILDLTANPLSGTIPPQLGNLRKITKAIINAYSIERFGDIIFFGALEGCFPPELKVWCDNGAEVDFQGHLNLPYPLTKFPAFCTNIIDNPNDPGICQSAGNCDEVAIIGGAGQITITGLTAPNEIVEVYDANWSQVFRCHGADCGNEQIISDLSAGNVSTQ